MTEMTTGEAAARLGVNQSRVRALVGSGVLAARRVGSQWLVDADSVDRQREMKQAHATGRAMAQRVAWAAGDLTDGGSAAWLSASDRSRLRRRLRDAASVDVLRRWLSSRASTVERYRVGERDLDAVLARSSVVSTGVSAATAYGLGLGTGSSGDAYVTADVAASLVRDVFLIESHTGNLKLRIVDHDLHLATARSINGRQVATRLFVGVDLADDKDTRTRRAGRALLRAVLAEQQGT